MYTYFYHVFFVIYLNSQLQLRLLTISQNNEHQFLPVPLHQMLQTFSGIIVFDCIHKVAQ
jgi:hypothetical protein